MPLYSKSSAEFDSICDHDQQRMGTDWKQLPKRAVRSWFSTFEWNSISYLFKKCIEIAILTAFSILPLLAVAAAGKNYILPVCVTLVYTFLSFILLMVNMYLHPLSSATAIIMRDIPGVILAQEVNIPAALFCIGIWTIVSIVFAYISLKHRK